MARTRLEPLQAFDQLTSFQLCDPELPRAIPMDAFRRHDRFIVQFDLPGVDPSSVSITHQRNLLQIRAERRPVRERGDEVSLTECPQGVLTRQLYLDESLDPRRLTAHCDRGVVTLTIPIARRARPEHIRLTDTTDVDQAWDPDLAREASFAMPPELGREPDRAAITGGSHSAPTETGLHLRDLDANHHNG